MDQKTTKRTTDETPMLRLVKGAEEAFLSGRRKKQADVESAVGIFLEMLRGFELFEVPDPCVTVFGSARVKDGHPYYKMTRDLGVKLANEGFAVMTGGGPGLMEAANRGGKEAGGYSAGCSITTPATFRVNDVRPAASNPASWPPTECPTTTSRDESTAAGSTPGSEPSSSLARRCSTICAVRVAVAGSPAPSVYCTLMPGATATKPRAAIASAR